MFGISYIAPSMRVILPIFRQRRWLSTSHRARGSITGHVGRSYCRTRISCLWLLATNFFTVPEQTPRHPSVKALYLCKYDLELKCVSLSAEDTEGFEKAVESHRLQVGVSRKRPDLLKKLNSCSTSQGRHPAELLC